MTAQTPKNVPPAPHVRRWIVWLALIGVLAIYLLECHARRITIPTLRTQGDQGAYLDYAEDLHRANYTFVGGRNRMPVYPFLLTFIYEDGMSDEQFLARAQSFNVNLSAGILLALFLLLRRYFSDLWSLSLVVITAFTVFLKRAVLVQTEVLFYLIVLVVFLMFWRLIVSPNWKTAIFAGSLLGIAHLTKASVLPLLVLWVAVMAAQTIWNFCTRSGPNSQHWIRPACIALVTVCFLGVTFQYLRTSKRIFGRYFYNVNSTFYFWTDSWEEAESLTKAHGDREGWPDMPPDKIPSPAKYWREHSIADIGARIGSGIIRVLTKNAKLTDYYKYGVIFGATAAFLAIGRRRQFLELIFRQPFVTLFVVGFFSGYLLLYAWYAPVSSDSRFSLSLFLPFLFVSSKLILHLGSEITVAVRGRTYPFASLFISVLLAMSALDVAYNAVRLVAPDSNESKNASITENSGPNINENSISSFSHFVSRG